MEHTVLLVNELVTNALLYSRDEVELRIAEGTTLLVEVTDTDEGVPRRIRADVGDERGRGLHVVGLLSRDWGVRRTTNGKIVWCEVALPEGVGDQQAPPWPIRGRRPAAEGGAPRVV